MESSKATATNHDGGQSGCIKTGDIDKDKNKEKIHFKDGPKETAPNEMTMDGIRYIRKDLYFDLQRRVFLLDSYVNSIRAQINSIKDLLKELKNVQTINR
jgi:hypothetical protein